jgi:hypothetical protein
MTSSPYLMVPIPIVDRLPSSRPGKVNIAHVVHRHRLRPNHGHYRHHVARARGGVRDRLARDVATSLRGMGNSAKMRRVVYAGKLRPQALVGHDIVYYAVTVCGIVAN